MSTSALELDLDGQSQYRTAIVEIIAFAVDKLNDKAVYANTLVFSGRVFGASRPAAPPVLILASVGVLSHRGRRVHASARVAGREAAVSPEDPRRGRRR